MFLKLAQKNLMFYLMQVSHTAIQFNTMSNPHRAWRVFEGRFLPDSPAFNPHRAWRVFAGHFYQTVLRSYSSDRHIRGMERPPQGLFTLADAGWFMVKTFVSPIE